MITIPYAMADVGALPMCSIPVALMDFDDDFEWILMHYGA